MKIKTALISVSDKRNLKPILNSLKKNNIKIISSGGTYKEIKKLKFKCIIEAASINRIMRFLERPSGCVIFAIKNPLVY